MLKHRKFKLSDSKAKWARNRDTTLQGEPVRLNPRTAEQYADEVTKEIRKMHLDVSSQLNALFASATAKNSIQKTERVALDGALDGAVVAGVALDSLPASQVTVLHNGVAMDASISSMARILTNKLIDKWTKRFNTFGKDWSARMIGKVETQSAKDLSRSMNKLSGGLTIKTDQISDKTRDKILASADQSASLIKTIGSNYTEEVKQAVARSITDDSQSFTQLKESIHSMLQDKYKKHRNKAHNVALDQTRKAYTSITTSRMRDIGVDEYTWRHSGGSQKPRDYHRDVLNGNVYSLSDPPVIDPKTGEKGKPGDLINCKCFIQPVIRFGNKKGG